MVNVGSFYIPAAHKNTKQATSVNMFLFKSRVVRGNAARLRTFTKLHPRGHVVCLFVHVACMELEYEEQSSSSSSELSSDEEV